MTFSALAFIRTLIEPRSNLCFYRGGKMLEQELEKYRTADIYAFVRDLESRRYAAWVGTRDSQRYYKCPK